MSAALCRWHCSRAAAVPVRVSRRRACGWAWASSGYSRKGGAGEGARAGLGSASPSRSPSRGEAVRALPSPNGASKLLMCQELPVQASRKPGAEGCGQRPTGAPMWCATERGSPVRPTCGRKAVVRAWRFSAGRLATPTRAALGALVARREPSCEAGVLGLCLRAHGCSSSIRQGTAISSPSAKCGPRISALEAVVARHVMQSGECS